MEEPEVSVRRSQLVHPQVARQEKKQSVCEAIEGAVSLRWSPTAASSIAYQTARYETASDAISNVSFDYVVASLSG
jgi:hypothetical protein